LLLGHALQLTRAELWARTDQPLDQGQQRSIERLIEQRAAGTPIAYLIGRQSFWEHEFWVTPETLIPRPDTELLIETILAQSDEQAHRVIDLGTGSGAIAISLAKARPNWSVYATDRSAAAIAVARKNAQGMSNITFVVVDWLSAFASGTFDIVVANPPYIAAGDPHLEALRFEPESALVAKKAGLADLQDIISGTKRVLRPNGYLLVEHGYNQQAQVVRAVQTATLQPIRLNDLAGRPRAVLAKREPL
jgi:release factor glutamine methyltransferase